MRVNKQTQAAFLAIPHNLFGIVPNTDLLSFLAAVAPRTICPQGRPIEFTGELELLIPT